MRTITMTEMEYRELDGMVEAYFPKAKFEFVADQEASNDTAQTFHDIKRSDFDDEKMSAKFYQAISGNFNCIFTARMFICWFVMMGILPEGNFLITVSW